MKICIVVPNLSGGGAEFVAREWAKFLAEAGDEVVVAITHPKETDPEIAHVEVIPLDGGGMVGHVRSLRRLYRDRGIDVVLSLLPYYNLLALSAALGSTTSPKVIISGRNVEVPFPEVHGRRYRLTRALARLLYPRADSYLAISHPVAAEAGALYRIRPGRISVIPNPATAKVDQHRQRNSAARLPDRATIGDRAALSIVVPARLVEQKRPLVPLEIASLLQPDYERVVVHYFGTGPMRKQIEEEALKNKVQVVMHGWVEDWFESCPPNAVVLLTSLAEGFGNVLVEAAAIGVPSVVSSRCLGASDAIVPGLTGQLVVGDTASEYADAIRSAREMKVFGIETWIERFSPKSSGVRLRQLLIQVVNR